mgnify:CR=1 FL=1
MDRQRPDVIPPEREAGATGARGSKIQRRWSMRPLGYSSLALPNVQIEPIGEAPDEDKRSLRRSWARFRGRLRRRVNSLL